MGTLFAVGLALFASGTVPAKPANSLPAGWRLLMDVQVVKTTDKAESSGVLSNNTEDEIFYVVAGTAVVRGKAKAVGGTFRRKGDPDVWVMGNGSLKTLQRNVFEGYLGRGDSVALNVTIAEQDNGQLAVLEALVSSLTGDLQGLAMTQLGWSSLGAAIADIAGDQMVNRIKSILEGIGSNGDQIVGSFNVGVTAGKLELSGLGTAGAKAAFSAVPTYKTLTLKRHGAEYRVKLRLVPRQQPRPKERRHLSTEKDMCSKVAITVPSTKGNVVIKKGEQKTAYLADRRFKWFCGPHEEWATAPKGTDLIVAKRAKTGRRVWWRCYEELTLSPDITL